MMCFYLQFLIKYVLGTAIFALFTCECSDLTASLLDWSVLSKAKSYLQSHMMLKHPQRFLLLGFSSQTGITSKLYICYMFPLT